MSRLTFMDETQSIVQNVADDLADLERIVSSGRRLDSADIKMLGQCSQKVKRLYAEILRVDESSGAERRTSGRKRGVRADARIRRLHEVCQEE